MRPIHIPVCRLPLLVRANGSTCWRRAQHGDYGPVTFDGEGRQQVEIARVEAAHRTYFTDAELAAALRTPSRNVTQDARKRERIRQLDPGPIILAETGFNFFCLPDAKAYALASVQKRDRQWMRLIAQMNGLD